MNLQNVFKVIIVRWKMILLFGVLCLTISTMYSLLADPVYKSTATIVAVVRAPDTIGPQSIAEQLASDYLLTQEDILKSERVARQVVKDTGIASQAGVAERFGWTPEDGSLPDFIAKRLSYGLSVESSVTNSRVMGISYFSGDPSFSAMLANAFAAAFIEVNVQLQGDPARRTIESYTRQLEAIGEKMRRTQSALAARERELGIVASRGESDPDAARLAALSSGLASVQVEAAAAASKTAASALPDAMSSPVIQGLQVEIARAEAQRQQLATDVGANHPDYRQLTSQIGGLRQQLGKQEALIRQSAQATASQVRMAQNEMSGAVATQRSQVIESRAAQNEVAVLQHDLANLRTSYDEIGQRRAQLEVLGNTAQTNISLLSPAIVTGKSVGPHKLIIVFFGTVVGFALGVLIALILEFANRRIRSSEQMETWLGIPDLGSIRLNTDERLKMVGFIAGLLPRPSA